MTRRPASPLIASLALLLGAVLALAQPAPTPPATVATPAQPPPSPVSGIRNKLSAGDLLSAESILEVHRERNGEDGPWLNGLTWLARGALLVGEPDKAHRYAADARARCADRMSHGASPQTDHDLETALGAAIEVEAQCRERSSGRAKAADYVRGELAQIAGPVALRSRLYKRLNLLTLEGGAAPEIAAEDWVGERPPTLASLRGKPVLVFVWAEGCGDCRAQEATLARAKARFAGHGGQLLALTRYYDADSLHGVEKARVDSVWKALYANVGTVPIVLSTASMERYGGSSTPTFVFVDRKGVVRRYTPTRLTQDELDRSLDALAR